MGATSNPLVLAAEAMLHAVETLSLLSEDPKAVDSAAGRLIIRATAAMIADVAETCEAEDRRRFAEDVIGEVMKAAAGKRDSGYIRQPIRVDVERRLRAAVDALVGVPMA